MNIQKQLITPIYLLIISSMALGSCSILKNGKEELSPEILSATSQKWHAGRKEGGTGIHYEIKVVVPKDNISFDSLYTKNFSAKVGVMKGNSAATTIQKGDTLTLKVGIKNGKATNLTKCPVNFSGEGVLSYDYNSDLKYLPIETFTKLQDLYYP